MKSYQSITLISSLIATTLFFSQGGGAVAASIAIIDQENPGPFVTTNGAIAPFSFGQSFTPTLPAIDAIEFLLGGDDATVVVNLREGVVGTDGLQGNIIAQSNPVLVDVLGNNFFQFDFPTRVSLVPGQVYVAELLFTTGLLGVRHTQGNQYAGGQFFSQDFSLGALSNTDLVFREGLTTPIPEPLTFFGTGVAIVMGSVFKRKINKKPSNSENS